MRLYHLTGAEYALSDIALRRIKIARIADLNDPFELRAANLGGNKTLRRGMAEWRKELNKSKGLLCFSRHWYSPVLWSHYADKHRGMCLGFVVADGLPSRVTYSDKRVRFDLEAMASNPSIMQDLLLTKYSHWAYEEESRIFVELDHKTAERGLYFYEFSEDLRLAEVILGPLCEISLDRIRDLVQQLYGEDIQVFRARLAFKSFNVVPKQSTLQRPYQSPVDGSVVELSKDDE